MTNFTARNKKTRKNQRNVDFIASRSPPGQCHSPNGTWDERTDSQQETQMSAGGKPATHIWLGANQQRTLCTTTVHAYGHVYMLCVCTLMAATTKS